MPYGDIIQSYVPDIRSILLIFVKDLTQSPKLNRQIYIGPLA